MTKSLYEPTQTTGDGRYCAEATGQPASQSASRTHPIPYNMYMHACICTKINVEPLDLNCAGNAYMYRDSSNDIGSYPRAAI